MFSYVLRRAIYAVPLLLVISFISFLLITAPPGDYMTTLQTELQNQGGLSKTRALEIANRMREKYGLDDPLPLRYFHWVSGIILRGDFGYSFNYKRPVSEVIWGRLGWTLLIAFSCHLFSVIGGLIPGIYSATHQYSIGDNIFTFLAFLGLSIPNFFLALILVYVLIFWFGVGNVGGLFSPQFALQPWTWAKFLDFLNHFWVPVLVVGAAGTARNMRVMRGNLLDVLGKQYTQVARAKGLAERAVIYKHALANAVQPIIMYLGMSLPWLIQGAIVTSIVLNLPTTGPMFYNAVITQDMYLAGAFILLFATVLVVGNLLADIALAWIDPRVRYE